MTYDLLKLDDGEVLDVLAMARREGAMTMIHAENHEIIAWLTRRLLDRGHGAPKYHAVSHARLYGLEHRKGSIAVGQDADLAIWDPERQITVSHEMLHDNMDYSPYEGRRLTGWPVTVLSRGRVVADGGELAAARGSGTFLPCGLPSAARPLGRLAPEVDPARNFGADVLG